MFGYAEDLQEKIEKLQKKVKKLKKELNETGTQYIYYVPELDIIHGNPTGEHKDFIFNGFDSILIGEL